MQLYTSATTINREMVKEISFTESSIEGQTATCAAAFGLS